MTTHPEVISETSGTPFLGIASTSDADQVVRERPGAEVALVPLAQALASEPLRDQWTSLARASANLRAVHQTPEWCAHKDLAGERVDLIVQRGATGAVLGVTPLQHTTYSLTFDVGKKRLWKKSLSSRLILGNEPLASATTQSYDDLFRALPTSNPGVDSICLSGVATDTPLFRYLTTSPQIASTWIVCVPHGTRRYHWLSSPPTFTEYLSKFSSKTRNSLKRTVKQLRERGQGTLELKRVETAAEVPEFVATARSIAERSWQMVFLNLPLSHPLDRAASLAELARANLLRCYLLTCGGQPCAYSIGFQLGDTFTFYETAYDQAYKHESPGQVLHFLLIEDLMQHNRPQRAFFGTKDATYKEFFGNVVGEEADVVLIKRTRRNWLWWRLHTLFRGTVNHVKRYVKVR